MPKSAANIIGPCRQIAALPWRIGEDGKVRILVVTSRTNARWMLPKGWPMEGKSDPDAALLEACEEARVTGTVSTAPLGSYHYIKMFDDGSRKAAQAVVYPICVTGEATKWDEKGQRERRWVRPRKAARMVFERDLSRFLLDLSDEQISLFRLESTPTN
nr:NUDIX hydrolase [uncultured Devosia sp.]